MANVRPLPENLQKIAISELNEVPERVADDIEALRTWIKQQKYMRARTDDQFLLAFLRGSKFSLERCKSKLDRYYTLITKFPDLFRIDNIDDVKIREVLNLGVLLPLPKPLGETGPRILILRNGKYEAEKYRFEDVFKVGIAIQQILMLEDDLYTVCGSMDCLDMADVSIGHFFQMNPTMMKKITVYAEEAVPIRRKATHFLNTPPGFYQIFNVFKPMLSVKQQNRLFVHGDNFEKLYDYIPQRYLPKEYGGENGTIPDITEYWNEKFDEYRDYFKQNANYGVDEKLRPGDPINFDSLFGIEGSFRKLDVD